jgi:hypothetical protein
MVDTGSTLTYLPWAVVDKIIAYTGAFQQYGEWRLDCKWWNDRGTVDFWFNDNTVKISVPLRDFMLPLGSDPEMPCVLGVQKRQGAENDALLGQTFLRGVYSEFSFLCPLSLSLSLSFLPPNAWQRFGTR